eukprot:1894545-Prymnesium_polylepis.1
MQPRALLAIGRTRARVSARGAGGARGHPDTLGVASLRARQRAPHGVGTTSCSGAADRKSGQAGSRAARRADSRKRACKRGATRTDACTAGVARRERSECHVPQPV